MDDCVGLGCKGGNLTWRTIPTMEFVERLVAPGQGPSQLGSG